MADDFKYHIDHHGSLVRPAGLVEERASGDAAHRAAAEEEAVVAAAHQQRRLTLSAVSDGQFRRDHLESVVYDNVDGFGPARAGEHPIADLAGIGPIRRRSVAGPLTSAGRLAETEVAPLLRTLDRPVFVQLPSPGYLALLSDPAATPATIEQSGAQLAEILRAEITALAAQGVPYVALANPLCLPFLTNAGRDRLAALTDQADALFRAIIAVDRAAVTALEVHEEFRVGLDLTDHGPLPTTERGYDVAALDVLLDASPFHRLCVDFPLAPHERLPIEQIKPGIVLSLGLVDVSNPAIETVDELLERADIAADVRGVDDIAFATNGGFAPTAADPLITEDQQHAKLQLVEMVSRYYWGNEI